MPWRLATAAVVWPGWLHCSTTLALNSALYLRLTGVGLPVLFGDCSIVCSIADSRFDGRNPPPIPRTHQYDFAGRLVRQQSWQEIVNESLILIRNGESIRPRVMRDTP